MQEFNVLFMFILCLSIYITKTYKPNYLFSAFWLIGITMLGITWINSTNELFILDYSLFSFGIIFNIIFQMFHLYALNQSEKN
jgi:hypothetical protein